MSDAITEVEAKFTINDDDRQRLAELSAVGEYAVVRCRTIDQHDLYFDTANAELAGAGSTLRVRQNQKGAFMTFKGQREMSASDGESHVTARLEDEVPVEAALVHSLSDDAALPDGLELSPLRRVRSIVGEATLLPTARLRNVRTTIELADSDGHQFELALDRCTATRLSDGRLVEFGEVELEAKTGDRAALLDLAALLQELAPSLIPSQLTKLERALK